jgi:hypothetical protein
MGIQDRDYMKRRPDDDDDSDSFEDRTDSFLGRFVSGHTGLFKAITIGLVLLVVLGIVMAVLKL